MRCFRPSSPYYPYVRYDFTLMFRNLPNDFYLDTNGKVRNFFAFLCAAPNMIADDNVESSHGLGWKARRQLQRVRGRPHGWQRLGAQRLK